MAVLFQLFSLRISLYFKLIGGLKELSVWGLYVTSIDIYLAMKTEKMFKYLWIHFKMTTNLSYSNKYIYEK